MAKKQVNIFKTIQNVAEQVQEEIGELLGDEPAGGKPKPIKKKVSLIIHNPRVPGRGNKKLNEVMRWKDPDALTERIIKDLHEASYGYINYEVVERIEVDGFPVKKDGFVYKADDFVRHLKEKSGFHKADAVDYELLLQEFDMFDKVNSGKVDEFWLYAFPYAGYYESIMIGPDAFWCNAPPLEDSRANRRFIIMGLNYQRGVGEALEAFGHRAESIMKYTFRKKRGDANLWDTFRRYDQKNPGKAEVGIMHFAPNSVKDYDWGNKTKVKSRHHTWYNFPDLSGSPKIVDCSEWGDGDTRAHHMWWYKHMPHIKGRKGGISYNWWEYIIDPNNVK